MVGDAAVLDRPLAINLEELIERVVVEVGCYVMARALSLVALGAVLLLLLGGRRQSTRLSIISTVDI